jgi:hypothetical protein
MRAALTCFLALLCLFQQTAANACSYSEPTLLDRIANKRVKQLADCSFVNGGLYDYESGEAAYDLENGRVAQMLSGDRALLADCKTGDTALVLGKMVGETTCGPYFDLSPYIYPKGKLKLNFGASLDEFIERARADGYEVDRGPLGQDGAKRDHFDELCGCKVFYPESAAAKN